jgi:hypothetical protein
LKLAPEGLRHYASIPPLAQLILSLAFTRRDAACRVWKYGYKYSQIHADETGRYFFRASSSLWRVSLGYAFPMTAMSRDLGDFSD